ncbi:MAG: hypothetical protein B6I20_00360 [Bacteroidetes bacterium 4572_117]|nr:MAG: hypothetical protein B6I20_00360 [Bacteroidetes bacterium 4572_117]
MIKDKIIYMLILVMIGTLACNNNIEHFESVDAMIADATKSVEAISTEDFKALLEAKHHFTVIDCREEKEFLEGHIPGAINIPRGMLEFSKLISDRRVKLYIYDQSNKRSALSVDALKKLKYKHLFMIDGGWEKWHANFPEMIEKGSGETQKGAEPVVEEEGGCG